MDASSPAGVAIGGVAPPPRRPRLLTLIDGVFFQTGMRAAGMHYRMDFPRLARKLPGQIDGGCLPVKLRFFIAASLNADTRKREQPLFDALKGSSSTELIEGWHERKECLSCKVPYHREKGTDVSIATALIDGAHRDIYDTALLISGDEDYIAAIIAARAVSTANGLNPHLQRKVIWGHFGTQATNGR